MRAIQRFGKQLQRLRTSRGLTQEQLAVAANSVSHVPNATGTWAARSFVEHPCAIGEGIEGLGDGVARGECQREAVVASGRDSLCN